MVLPAVNEINQHGAEGDFFVSYEGVREGKAFIKIRFMLTKSAERDDRDMRLQGRARRGRAFAAIAGPGSGLAIGVAYQPTDAVLDQLRTIAPGWDRQALLARYREWSKGKARPDNPHGAFIGWARRFTPASRMPIWVRRPPPWRLSSIARSICEGRGGWSPQVARRGRWRVCRRPVAVPLCRRQHRVGIRLLFQHKAAVLSALGAPAHPIEDAKLPQTLQRRGNGPRADIRLARDRLIGRVKLARAVV